MCVLLLPNNDKTGVFELRVLVKIWNYGEVDLFEKQLR